MLLADEELYTVIARDITERLAQKRDLEYRATHDALTTLPNRSALVSYMEQVLRGCTETSPAALLMLDLSRFKEVNDTLGHDVGDRLLTAVVPRLQAVVRPGDTIARFSGDEFVIVCGEIDDESDPMLLAEAILDAFAEPFAAAGEEHVLSVSIGLTIATPEATPQELLSDADAKRLRELAVERIFGEALTLVPSDYSGGEDHPPARADAVRITPWPWPIRRLQDLHLIPPLRRSRAMIWRCTSLAPS